MLASWLPLSVVVWLVQQLVFHVTGIAAEYCDQNGLFRRFKVRDPDRRPYARLLPLVLLNQCFVLLPSMILAQAAGVCFTGDSQLTLGRFAYRAMVMAVGHDIVQYATHRFLLHQPSIGLMRALRHSVHHSTTASRGISACYMSAPDFFLEIVLPYLVPLAVVGGGGSSVIFHSLIAGLGAIGGIYEHSGYDFAVDLRQQKQKPDTEALPGGLVIGLLSNFLDNRAHGEHHARGNVSFSDGFGSPGICDSIFGTRWDMAAARRQEAEREWKAQREQLRTVMEHEEL